MGYMSTESVQRWTVIHWDRKKADPKILARAQLCHLKYILK